MKSHASKSRKPRSLSPRLFGLGLTFISLGAGCLSHPPLDVKTFTLNVEAPSQTNTAGGGPLLGIRSVQVAGAFDDRHLTYRTGEYSFVKDPYAAFLSPPEEEFQTVLLQKLRETGLFGSVTTSGGGRKAEIVAEINITQLFGDFTKPGEPVAVLSISFDFRMVTNGLPGKVLLQKYYSQRVGLHGATASDLIGGWNAGLERILVSLGSDMWQRLAKIDRTQLPHG
jgi:hypothetical protein